MSTIAEALTVKRLRIESIDILRGVVMIGVNPTDPTQTPIALFFTRSLTYF